MIFLEEYPTTQNTLLSVNFTIYISLAWHKEWLTVFFQPQKQFWFQTSSSAISDIRRNFRFITPPARRARRSYKFASLRFSVLFSVSQVGLPLMGVTAVHSCLSHVRLLNSISSGTCRQNTPFNMYTTTSKQQEGYTFKDFASKMFYNDKFHREAFAKGGESR